MDQENILYEVKDGVAIVTINRPASLNALNLETLEGLADAIEQALVDEEVLALVLTGAGEKAFVAGADIKEIAELDGFTGRDFALSGQDVFQTLASLPKATIAAINGFALGGGLELALACDIRVAHTQAQLGLPEVSLGVIPGFGGTQRLTRLIGLGPATELVLTGARIDAARALQLGLVSRVTDTPLETGLEIARSIVANGPVAVALAKEALNRGASVDLAQGLEIEADLFALACITTDKAEGTRAFLEKRRPKFAGS
jgi:enoyl-CoA hydratase